MRMGLRRERCGSFVEDDGEQAARVVSLDADGDAESFASSPLGELGDVPLAAAEPVLAFIGLEQEALEVAEAIEDQAGDLAGACAVHFSGFGRSSDFSLQPISVQMDPDRPLQASPALPFLPMIHLSSSSGRSIRP
jgi:hypothetical protein